MNTATLTTGNENSTPQHRSLRAVTRQRAFVTHLALSALIVGTACALIFLLWYPHPYFQAVGAWSVLRVLILVDVGVGPLLTLIVFKPGKRGLKLDMAVIALVQLAALVYGVTTIYRERPYFTVFAVDRFFVLAQRDVDLAQFADAQAEGRLGSKPFRAPMLTVATRPADLAGMQKLLDETVFNGKPDIERRPEFWSRYEDGAAQVIARDRPLAALRDGRPDAAAKIAALVVKLGLPEERLGFVPMIAKNRDVTLVVDAQTGAPLEVLDVDPWIGDVPSADPAGAPPPAR
jgi:hypothetical protein